MKKVKLNLATERIRQARLRARRKSEGWRRVSVWLSPGEAAILETLGDEWLGRTVKTLLFEAIDKKGSPLSLVPDTAPETFELALSPVPGTETGSPQDIMGEVDTLLAAGLSGSDIARQFNEAGRRTAKGAEYRGANLLRDWRKWKGAV